MNRKNISLFASAALLSLSGLCAHAQLMQISSPTGLNAADVITPGYPDKNGDILSSPFHLSAGGNTVTFSAQNGFSFSRHDAGTSIDFPFGTKLLLTYDFIFTHSIDGPLQLDFASGIREFGLSAQDYALDSESFTVNAYDDKTLLGSFTTPMTDNISDVGTALFLGGKVTGSDVITTVTVSSTSSVGLNNLFFFGPVTFATATPEPGTLALLLSSGIGGGLLLRRKSRR
jgi:hypothetical protein